MSKKKTTLILKKGQCEYIEGFSKDMYVMKPGHLDFLKNEKVENGQIKMHYPEVLF